MLKTNSVTQCLVQQSSNINVIWTIIKTYTASYNDERTSTRFNPFTTPSSTTSAEMTSKFN